MKYKEGFGRIAKLYLFSSAAAISILIPLFPSFLVGDRIQAATPITPSGLNTQVNLATSPPPGKVQYDITGGTRPGGGANLFHSFGDFNVPNNNIANFLNETGLPTSNILGRVTGGTLSSIFGTIQTTGFGNANLFLINPMGFLFGPNATVNVGGMVSFSSADYLRLADGVRFNAVPDAAADALLSPAPVAAFGFLGSNPGAITVQGSQFTVTEGTGISLVGGNITIESGTPEGGTAQPAQLIAPNGKIQLASARSPGEFDAATLQALPNVDGASFTSFGSVSLAPGSNINISGQNTVSIRGGQFVLSVNDAMLSTAASVGAPETISLSPTSSIISSNASLDPGADVQILAGNIQMDGASIQTLTSGDGSGGNISISGLTVSLMNGAQMVSSTSGAGAGGNIDILATDSVSISGYDTTGTLSGVTTLFSDPVTFLPLVTSGVFTTASSTGNGGNVSVTSQAATLENGGTMATITSGDGRGGDLTLASGTVDIRNAGILLGINGINLTTFELIGSGEGGNITVTATDYVRLSQFNTDLFTSGAIFTQAANTAKAGDIAITAPNVILDSGGTIGSFASGEAPAGSIFITAPNSVSISGFDPFGNSSTIQTFAEFGDGGPINIRAGSLSMSDRGLILTGSFGNGSSGSINLQIDKALSITGGALVASSGGATSSGDITVSADTVTISGMDGFSRSRIENINGGEGATGKISITAREVTVTDNARINSEGANGREEISISATESVTVSDGAKIRMVNESGPGGLVEISAPTIMMHQGIIQTETVGGGDAGAITIHADNLTLDDSFINAMTSQGIGRGGDVTVNVTNHLSITGQFNETETDFARPAGIYTETRFDFGTGAAGNILVTANTIDLSGGATINSNTFGAGNAGDVTVNASSINIESGARVTSGSLLSVPFFEGEQVPVPTGHAGTVTLQGFAGPAQSILIDGQGSGVFTDTQGTGAGGNIFVNANTVTLSNGGALSAATSGTAPSATGGTITVEASQILLTNQASIRASAETKFPANSGSAGNITLLGDQSISLLGNSSISSTTNNAANGGSIRLTAPRIEMQGQSNIGADTAGLGNAGNILLEGNQVILGDGSRITARTQAEGNAGDITIHGVSGDGSSASDVGLSGNSQLVSETIGDGVNIQGTAGSIRLDTARLNLSGASLINTASRGSTGAAGNITVNATDAVTISDPGSQLFSGSTEFSFGDAGHIFVSAPSVIVENGGAISTITGLVGNAGTITVNTNNLQVLSGGHITSSSVAEFPDIPPSGAAGTVIVQGLASPAHTVLIDGTASGIFTDTQGTGAGGNIIVNANSVTLKNGGTLSAATSGTEASASGGTITINANQVQLTSGGLITASTTGAGVGGSITIGAGSTFASNASTVSSTAAQATGGDINITAGQSVTLENDSLITAGSTGAGNAGNIVINAGQSYTSTNSSVTTKAEHSSGGNITVLATGLVQLTNSELNASVEGSKTTVGGNILIDPVYVILQNSQILAKATQGTGGNINIFYTGALLSDSNSEISASSQFGQSGTVTFQSPNSPASGKIVPLGKSPLLSTSLFNQRCAALTGGNFSSFTVAGRETLPAEPGSWLATPLALGSLSQDKSLEATSERETPLLSLRQIAPPGFLTQSFAVESSGCQS
jgi:filamentous hemagglutinin family protein